MARKVIIGTFIDTPTLGAVRIVHNQRLGKVTFRSHEETMLC